MVHCTDGAELMERFSFPVCLRRNSLELVILLLPPPKAKVTGTSHHAQSRHSFVSPSVCHGHLGSIQLLIGHNTAGALLQFEGGMFPVASC